MKTALSEEITGTAFMASSTTVLSTEQAARPALQLPATALRTVFAGILLVIAFWPILTGIYGSWFDEHAYMEHGSLVLPAAAFIAWTKRSELRRISLQPSKIGFALVFMGALQAVLGIAAHWVWISRIAFLISLIGCIVGLYGFRVARALAYPLGMLPLMIAPPTFLYAKATLSLQLLASRLGESCLEFLGFSVLREGNVLHLVGMTLSVEEACSGIRSLFAILFICAVYNYLFVQGTKPRLFLFVMALPIAILGNGARIVATGIASQYNQALVYGTPHEMFGYASVIFACAGCICLHRVLLVARRRLEFK